jgi:competence ComEA-like helix-hairpin-helix protein
MRNLTIGLLIGLLAMRLTLLSPLYDQLLSKKPQIIEGQMAIARVESNEMILSGNLLNHKSVRFKSKGLLDRTHVKENKMPLTTSDVALLNDEAAEETEKVKSLEIYDPVLEDWISLEDFNLYNGNDLQHFKGIGIKTAEAIIAYRENYGPFKAFEELVAVKGIGEKKMNQLLNKENEY